jgi:hypothetical protein
MAGTPKLIRVHRLDSVKLDETYFTEEGYLIDHPIVTSVGIFEYHQDGNLRRELRLPEHVFDEKSLATYEGKPVIITHEAGRVSKANVDSEIVGTILTQGYRDGDDVRTKIIIHSIDDVKRSGLRELSLGYDLVLDETPGEWNGQPYDAIQTEIAINHLALVRDARAGEQARLNIDGNTQILKGARSMSKHPKNKNAMTSNELKSSIAAFNARRQRRLDEDEAEEKNDGEEFVDVKASDEGEAFPAPPPAEEVSTEEKIQLIKDRRDRRDQEGDPSDPDSALGVIAQQDEDIDELIGLIEELQAASDFNAAADSDDDEKEEKADCDPGAIGGGGKEIIIKTDSVDAIVRERIKLGRIGDRLNLDGLEDMNPYEAKKAIIRKVVPSMRLDGKGRNYIEAAFELAVDTMNATKDTNYQRRQMMSNRTDSSDYKPTGKTSAEQARERMVERMMNGGNE